MRRAIRAAAARFWHGGDRTAIVLQDGIAHAFALNGHDWSQRYLAICQAAEALPCRSAVIEGKVAIRDAQRISAKLLKRAIAHTPERLVFIASDLLHLDGRDLHGASLLERRERLRQLLRAGQSCIEFAFTAGRDGLPDAESSHGSQGRPHTAIATRLWPSTWAMRA